MNSNGSRTTTLPRAASSPTGTDLGSPGSTAHIASARSDAAIPDLTRGLQQAAISPDACSEFRAAIHAPPATDQWLEFRVRACLSLYYRPDEDARLEGATIALWQKALGKLPGPVVAHAFDTWEAEREHRPAPGHIANIARRRWQEQAHAAHLAEREPERPFEPVVLTEAEQEQRAVVSEVPMGIFRSPAQKFEDWRCNQPEENAND